MFKMIYHVWSFVDVVRGRISAQPAAHKGTSCAVAAVAAAGPPRGSSTQPSYVDYVQTIPRKNMLSKPIVQNPFLKFVSETSFSVVLLMVCLHSPESKRKIVHHASVNNKIQFVGILL